MSGENKKKLSISEMAKMSTLSESELEEANANYEQNLEVCEEGSEGAREEAGAVSDAIDENGAESAADTVDEPEKNEPQKLVHEGTIISVEAKPSTEDMFRFMFRHTYFDPIGVVGVLISIAAIAAVIFQFGEPTVFTNILLIGVAALFLVISPLRMYARCKKHAEKVGRGEGIITYTFSEAGFDMTRNEEYGSFQWKQVYKAIEGKTGFYTYLNRNQAFVIPKADLGENIEAYKELFRKNASAKACRF